MQDQGAHRIYVHLTVGTVHQPGLAGALRRTAERATAEGLNCIFHSRNGRVVGTCTFTPGQAGALAICEDLRSMLERD